MRTGRANITASAGILCLALAIAAPAPLRGQAGSPGGIFDFGAGARPLAMGGAYTAMVKDATSLYYNPSGLSMLGGRNVAFMHATLFESASYDYLGYAQNFGRLPGGWGAQFIRLNGGSGEGRDEYNQPASGFSYAETAISAGAGLHGLFMPSLSAGFSIKVLNRALGGESNRLIGFDIGARYGPFLGDRLSVSLVTRNIGSFAMGDTGDKLPLVLKAGAVYALASNISLCADVDDTGAFQLGTEYGIGPGAVRFGYDKDSFSFGGGLKFFKSYELDYAMMKHPVLGLSNRVSLAYFFGRAVAAPPRVRGYAGDYLKRAEDFAGKRDYTGAYEAANMAIGMDPDTRKGPWAEKSRRLGEFVQGLKLKELPERQKFLKADTEQAVEAGKAVTEYLEGNNARSMLLAHSALGYQPGSAFFGEFLDVMGGVTKLPVRKDEILPRTALAREKLRKAEESFQLAEYDKAARQCEEVLLLEENNALAWTRLGSAYYALGDLERSRKAFVRALELDPGNTSVKEFMLLQGWTR